MTSPHPGSLTRSESRACGDAWRKEGGGRKERGGGREGEEEETVVNEEGITRKNNNKSMFWGCLFVVFWLSHVDVA